jgi:hypothetical protein
LIVVQLKPEGAALMPRNTIQQRSLLIIDRQGKLVTTLSDNTRRDGSGT